MNDQIQELATPTVGSCIWFDGGSRCGVAMAADDGFSDSGFPGCQFRIHNTVGSSAVNIEVTGRTIQRHQGSPAVRIRIEFVGDCEPSTFCRGWIAV